MIIVILCVILDQLSKLLVSNLTTGIPIIHNILEINYVENRGAVFGLMQGSNYILAVISILICICVVIYIYRQKKLNKKINVAWYLVLAGGIGNLIDRIFRGYVIDFIATPFISTFNLADSFIVIGVGIIIINELLDALKKKFINTNPSK